VNHVVAEVVDESGGQHQFFIDTGASFSVVTPRFLETVDAPARGSAPCGEAHGAGGPLAGPPQFHEARNLRVGGLLIERAGAVSVEFAQAVERELGVEVHGVLGYNVLSHLVTLIDYHSSEVTFFDPHRPEALKDLGTPDYVLPFRLRLGALIEVKGSVNDGENMPFIVDIGSRFTILNRTASRSSGIAFERRADNQLALGCGGGPGLPVEHGQADRLRFGSILFDEPQLHLIDMPVFATLGLANEQAGIFGNDLLSHYRVAIDYDKSELRFWQS
jgi:hypothetical protein